MKTNKPHFMKHIDRFNLAAIKAWESLGIHGPNEHQIHVLEKIFKFLAKADRKVLLKIKNPESTFITKWTKLQRDWSRK